MSVQPERADQEVVDNDLPEIDTPLEVTDWTIEGIERDLTPLQYHYLSLLKRLISTKEKLPDRPQLRSCDDVGD